MKKVLAFVLVAVLVLSVFSFVGCNIELPKETYKQTTESTAKSTTTKPITTSSSTSGKEDNNDPVDDVNGSAGLVYELIDNVTGYKVIGMGEFKGSKLVIPSTYKGLPVAVIGQDAFNSNTDIISVFIPDSVTAIEAAAFKWCRSLVSVTFGENSRLSYIDGEAFGQCTALESISIPESVTYIASAFIDCSSLTTVYIGNSIKVIGRCAFSNCNSLTTMYYDGTVLEWSEIDIDDEWIVSIIPFSFTLVCSDETRIISE